MGGYTRRNGVMFPDFAIWAPHPRTDRRPRRPIAGIAGGRKLPLYGEMEVGDSPMVFKKVEAPFKPRLTVTLGGGRH